MSETLNNSEAVYGFAAWLTCRDKDLTIGATHDAAVVADLVAEFCKVNKLDEVRGNYPDYLTHPD